MKNDNHLLPITDTGLLELTGERKWTHFGIVWMGFLLIFIGIIISIYYYFQEGNWSGFKNISLLLVIGLIVSIAFFFNQRRKLKFYEINTNVSREQNLAIIRSAVRKLDWSVTIENKHFIEAHKKYKNSWSWGEMITILVGDGNIRINSICGVDQGRSQAFLDGGVNQENIEAFEEEIYKRLENGGLSDLEGVISKPLFEDKDKIPIKHIPEVFAELEEKQIEKSFAAFIFQVESGDVNIQFSYENNIVGFDYILLASGNIAYLESFLKFAESEGFKLKYHKMNGVEYYRAEEGDLVKLGTSTIVEFFGLNFNEKVDFIIEY